MSCNPDECGSGLLPDFPYAIKYNTGRCPLMYPNWKFDPHRQDFCNKWGNFAPHICSKPCNPYKDIHVPMCSLDKFTKPSLFQTSRCKTSFRYQRDTFRDDPRGCPRPYKRSAYDCDKPSNMINQTVYGDDVVCGNCPPEVRRRIVKQEDPCEMIEFPFIITQCPEVRYEPIKIRTGAERCLHPSKIRYLTSTTKAAIPDFYKTKSAAELDLYRSKYAIDNRRPGPTLPCGQEDKVCCDWPVVYHAKCAQWKGGNMKPSYKIQFPPSLTLQKMDFAMGDLTTLPTNCKIMPVVVQD